MSNYTQTTNFATKDALASGNALKIVKGTEINVEFANIATAVATKVDSTGAAISGATITTSTIDSSTIGATTPSTGAFTTLSATGTTSLTGATTISNALLPVIDNIKLGYTTTATAAGTTTLLLASNNQQFFTGSTTQTVVLPVTSTLVLGLSYLIVNNSTGVLTVQSSGLNTITLIPAGAAVRCTCILITGTTAASWSFAFEGSSNIPYKQVQSISASIAGNAMTISATSLALDFRNTTLGSGTVTTVSGTPANLIISSGSTLGTVSAIQSRIVVIAMNNAGTIELAAVNISGGFILDESTLISTTAEGGLGAADSATVIYSTTARTSVAYRVIGYIDSTQATAGSWATAPSTIQGNGGQASISLAMNASGLASMFAARAWVNFNGSTNTNLSGTYTRTSPSTTLTVTATAHGLIVGSSVNLDFTTGTGLDGIYTVVTVADANTFTITTVASTTTSGNVTLLRNTIRGSGNVSSVTDNGTGDYTVNFTTAMTDANYATVGITEGLTGANTTNLSVYDDATFQTTSSVRVTSINNSSLAADRSCISVSVFR